MARYVRVSSISYAGVGGSGEDRKQKAVEGALALIDRAAWDRPDFIVLPETFNGLGCGHEEWLKSGEAIPGPTFDALAAKARQHRTYVICPVLEKRDGRLYNTAALIGRDGQFIGRYDKVHPTINEIEGGVTPGVEMPVFETDVGRVGMAICFDLNFRDVAEGLSRNGAEVVFFPSMYRGGLSLSVWAFEFSFWMVSATPRENSAIVNPLGQWLAQSFMYCPIISRRINLDSAVLHIDYNHRQYDAMKAKYGDQIQLDILAPEAVFMLTCDHPTKTVRDIIREFDLELRTDYFARANRVREAALKGGVPASAASS